ncbi:extracellular solute-binding protein [Halovulum sp. GXIMD14794]
MKHLVLAASIAAATMPTVASAETELVLGRFFGACEGAGTDPTKEVGEPCIIESIIRGFSAEDNGITVSTLPTEWNNYYDQIKAAYAGGNPPDVHVMHRHRVLEFASLGAIAPITEDLEAVGIDTGDWAELAKDAVTHDGEIYAVPLDFHALLWHVNVDIMEEAGLLNEDGTPKIPQSVDELLAQAQTVQEKTGKEYLGAGWMAGPMGIRLVLSWIMQQDSNIFEGEDVTVDTPEARNAMNVLLQMMEAGQINNQYDYPGAQQAFLDGDVAVLANGTWVVDFYDAQAKDASVPLQDYYVTDYPTIFGTPAAWADTHMWAIPRSVKEGDPEKYQAALELLAWINDNNASWAKTGHMAVRNSVLESAAYKQLPHRADYAETANIAKDIPPTVRYGAIQDTLAREMQAVWLGEKSLDDALADAQLDIEDLM